MPVPSTCFYACEAKFKWNSIVRILERRMSICRVDARYPIQLFHQQLHLLPTSTGNTSNPSALCLYWQSTDSHGQSYDALAQVNASSLLRSLHAIPAQSRPTHTPPSSPTLSP